MWCILADCTAYVNKNINSPSYQFWDKWTEGIQNPCNFELCKDKGIRYIYYTLAVPPSTKFQLSLYDQPFSSYRPFWDKCTEWLKNYLEHYKVKGHPIYALLEPLSLKFHSISVYDRPLFRKIKCLVSLFGTMLIWNFPDKSPRKSTDRSFKIPKQCICEDNWMKLQQKRFEGLAIVNLCSHGVSC